MAAPGTRFVALRDFYSRELKSHYVEGLSYTVPAPQYENGRAIAVTTLLAGLADEWLAEDPPRIKLYDQDPGKSRVTGSGTVS